MNQLKDYIKRIDYHAMEATLVVHLPASPLLSNTHTHTFHLSISDTRESM